MAYVERLDGTAKLRPDMKLVVARAFATPKARLNAALQISRGLAKAAG
jgi:transcription-repair coupling factor (superfamily II helicase)